MTGPDIVKRYDAMNDHVIGNWMNLWQECADWSMPTNDNINRVRIAGQEKPPQRLIDTCIEALYNFASGFFSNVFPPNTVWAKIKHIEPKFMDIPAVADYFERVSRIIHGLMVNSNFAEEEFQSLQAMGCFGTSCLSAEETDEGTVKFKNYMIDKVRIAENYQGTVDTVSREFELDSRQAIQQFGKDALSKANLSHIVVDDQMQKGTKYKFIHYVCPRTDFDKNKKDKKNKKFASFYVSREGESIISEGGFDYLPYKAARFSMGNDEVYGRSPMSMKLGTARRSNVIYRSVIVAGERHVNEQWLVADDDTVAQKSITSRPGALIKYRASTPGGKPERLPPNGDPGIGIELLDRHDEEIRRAFFNHLFRPLEDYRNMTAWEAQERTTTDMMALASFFSRYTNEKVTPIIEYVYYLAQKNGLLPPIPMELQKSPDWEVEYVGKLALATKSFETLGAIGTTRTFIELAQGAPQMAAALDNVDTDKLFRDSWHSASASMNSLKAPDAVKKERAARKQAAMKQKQIDNLAPIADATMKMGNKIDPESIIGQAAQ